MGWILGTAGVLLFITIFYYNRFIKLRNSMKEALATMNVYFKKRFDLVPNIMETVKGYAAHEKLTLDGIVRARNMVQHAGNSAEKIHGEQEMSSALKSLFAVAEGYPELKANENFLALQQELSRMETEIAGARKYYNGTVKQWNNAVEMFPSNLLAKIFGFESMTLFEVEDAAERENVHVSF